jgi:hypothetical protein
MTQARRQQGISGNNSKFATFDNICMHSDHNERYVLFEIKGMCSSKDFVVVCY